MKLEKVETMNIYQAKEAILQAVRMHFCKDENGIYRMNRRHARPLCLMGPTGIGKTEIVRQVAEEQNIPMVSYSITHHTRQSLVGLPRLVEQEINGEMVAVTEYTMSEIIHEIYQVMEETGKEEGILFLDEFNCASASVWPIMLQLLQEKTLGTHGIPKGWMLILAGNLPVYNAGATELDTVIADRMRMLWVEPDYTAWREYAQKKEIHPVVLSYLNSHRDHFYLCRNALLSMNTVTARGWEDLAKMLQEMEQKGFPITLPVIAQYLQDGEVVRSFYIYYHQYEKFVASRLADKILCGDEDAVELLRKMPFEEKWGLISILMDTLHTLAADATEQEETACVLRWEMRKIWTKCYLDYDQDSLQMKLFSSADKARNKRAKEMLMQWSMQVREVADDWEMLRKDFADRIVAPLQKKKQELANALNHVIHAFCENQLDHHHLEYLFNELAEDEEILQIALQCDVPEMKKLFQVIFFHPGDEALQIFMELQREKKSQKRKSA